MALEHDQADAEILNRASAWPRPRADRAGAAPRRRHADDPGLGSETADRETGCRRALPGRLVAALQERGYKCPRRSCSTAPTPPASSSAISAQDPVDLLVVGSHGHGMVRDLLFGQTVDRVRHSLDVPMLIARPDRGAVSHLPFAGRVRALAERPTASFESGTAGFSDRPAKLLPGGPSLGASQTPGRAGRFRPGATR